MTSLALALLLVLARGLNIEVVHADSPRWRVASGDIHGAEPIASDAIGCPAGDLFYLGGIAAENSSIELLFSGTLVLYGATSPIGGPLDLFIDAVPWKSFDEHADEGPMRCTVIGAWNSPAGGQQHILRVEYAGESERQGFIINATILNDAAAVPPSQPSSSSSISLLSPVPPASTSGASRTTLSAFTPGAGLTTPAAPRPSANQPQQVVSSRTSRPFVITIAIPVVVVGSLLLLLTAFGLYHSWKGKRSLRAPSAAFRAETRGGTLPAPWQRRSRRTTDKEPTVDEKADGAVAQTAGPSTRPLS